MGQLIAEPSTPDSAAVHSSVSGTVLSVSEFPHPSGMRVLAAEIENDGRDLAAETIGVEKEWNEVSPLELVRKISACGIVGMGGAGIPAHLKLSPPADKPIDVFIVNCTECEPLVSADFVIVKHHAGEILTGARIIQKILGAKKTLVAADSAARESVAALSAALKDRKFRDLSVVALRPKYPQSAEKILVKTLTKREVPSCGRAADVGCVVHNAATVRAIAQAVLAGTPLYQRVLTTGGPCVASPKNLLVRIGTPARDVLERCGADMKRATKVIMGGPMRGNAQADLDTPVIKTTYGVFAYDTLVPGVKRYDCIGCGRCARACPMRLFPSYLMRFVDKKKTADVREWGVVDCIECGSCAYVCPAKINLVHFMKLGKYRLGGPDAGHAACEGLA
jgi:electron transport complex protein RnfC